MNRTDKKAPTPRVIAQNRKARHDYFIEENYEAGIVLQGWEVKSLRDGRAQLKESYVVIKNGEAWLIGSHFSPLQTASTHAKVDPTRSRKLLLHRRQLDKLIGAIERKGYTLVPLELYWDKNHVKLDLGLAKGKKLEDKRESEKEHDWKRLQGRIMKSNRLSNGS